MVIFATSLNKTHNTANRHVTPNTELYLNRIKRALYTTLRTQIEYRTKKCKQREIQKSVSACSLADGVMPFAFEKRKTALDNSIIR